MASAGLILANVVAGVNSGMGKLLFLRACENDLLEHASCKKTLFFRIQIQKKLGAGCFGEASCVHVGTALP